MHRVVARYRTIVPGWVRPGEPGDWDATRGAIFCESVFDPMTQGMKREVGVWEKRKKEPRGTSVSKKACLVNGDGQTFQ